VERRGSGEIGQDACRIRREIQPRRLPVRQEALYRFDEQAVSEQKSPLDRGVIAAGKGAVRQPGEHREGQDVIGLVRYRQGRSVQRRKGQPGDDDEAHQ